MIVTVCTVLVIWGHSMVPGALSSEESSFFLRLLQPVWNSLGLGHKFSLDEYLVRKLFGHFLEYTILGCELGLLVRRGDGAKGTSQSGRGTKESRHSPWSGIFMAAGMGLAVAAIDELIQRITPDRGPSLKDVLLDLCGVLAGIVLAKLISLVGRRCPSSRKNPH